MGLYPTPLVNELRLLTELPSTILGFVPALGSFLRALLASLPKRLDPASLGRRSVKIPSRTRRSPLFLSFSGGVIASFPRRPGTPEEGSNPLKATPAHRNEPEHRPDLVRISVMTPVPDREFPISNSGRADPALRVGLAGETPEDGSLGKVRNPGICLRRTENGS